MTTPASNAQTTSTTPADAQPAQTATGANASQLSDVCVIEEAEAGNRVLIARPVNETQTVQIEPGKEYIFGFSKTDPVSWVQNGDDVTVSFSCGGILILKDYAKAMSSADSAQFAFSAIVGEGVLDGLIQQAAVDQKLFEETAGPAAKSNQASNQASGKNLNNIEPAAGDMDAQKVAQIEPAAGDQAGGPGAQNSGYGFNSSFSSQPVGPLNPIGPIDPTALRYGVEFRAPLAFLQQQTPDANPILISPQTLNLDETNLSAGPLSTSGTINVDFGGDAPGPIAPSGNFFATGSLAGGVLSSNGVPVIVTQTLNGYSGTAGGTSVFTLVIDPVTGNFTYTQLKPFDNADSNNPNDVVALVFGVQATDGDGDTAVTSLVIAVADDAPPAVLPDTNTISESALSAGPIVISDSLIVGFGQDGPGAVAPNGVSNVSGALAGGALTSGGVPVVITQTANGYAGTAGGVSVFTLSVNPANGAYDFTLIKPLDHSISEGAITLGFGVRVTDYDGDSVLTTITVNINDSVPVFDSEPGIGSGIENVDETNLGPITVNGNLNADFGGDGAGMVTPHGGFASSVELMSLGAPVMVTQTTNGYVGKANGVDVFTITINPATGGYSFTLLGVLDHPNTSDPNDVISLDFGVKITDADGDTDTSSIVINIFDDGPVAVNDGAFVASMAPVTGNVLGNDDAGSDGLGAVKAVTFNGVTTTIAPGTSVIVVGTYGTLTIGSNGAYSYTAKGGVDGTDTFRYTMNDYDGDSSSANLSIGVTVDKAPVLVQPEILSVDETNMAPTTSVSDTVEANFFGDGPGTISGNGGFVGGPFTSHGQPVTVSFNAGTNTYTGTAGGVNVFTLAIQSNGNYTFNLLGVLDHPNAADANDALSMQFGVRATDADGDSANGVITINVLDDGPVAVNDGAFVASMAPVTGNVLGNDDAGSDGLGAVKAVTFNGVTTTIAPGTSVIVVGTYGTLTIGSNGAYSYTAKGGVDGTDTFRYTMNDYDGDSSSANLSIGVTVDQNPIVVTPDVKTIDETNLGPISVNGAVAANFFNDGPGSITANGGFTSGGSKLAGNLTSNGVAVVVTQTANGYVGMAGATKVFEISINASNGNYTFSQFGVLDHADASNPNDVITLNFGVKATDADGDVANTSITINVLDDAPIAYNDVNTQEGTATGNVVTGLNGGPGAADDLSNDVGNRVTQVSFEGTTVNVPAVGTAVINGHFGVLNISADGSYTYNPFAGSAGGLKTFNGGPVAFPDMNESQPLDATEQQALGIADGNLDINSGDQISVTFVSEVSDYNNTLGAFTVLADGTLNLTQILIGNGNTAPVGPSFNMTAGAGDTMFGLFVIANGFSVNGGYSGIDLNSGSLDFIYNYGLPTERTANINDDGANIKLVYTAAGGAETVLNGPLYFTTERGGAENLNADDSVRVVSSFPPGAVGDTVLRIGFEDLPNLGDRDYNDMVFDLRIVKPAVCGEDVFTYTIADNDGDTSNATLTLDCAPLVEASVIVNNGANSICIKEDTQSSVPVFANYTGGDGDEVMTLTLTGVKPDWTVTAPAGWNNLGGGVYAITLAVGQSVYSGNFAFRPPANSDVDMTGLKVTASVYDPDTATSKISNDSFDVIVDAVVDGPNLTVPGMQSFYWNVWTQYSPNIDIASSVNDTDGSEIITKIVLDLNNPFTNQAGGFTSLESMGVSLSKGVETSPGVWEIAVNNGNAQAALAGLQILVPAGGDSFGPIHQYHVGGHDASITVKSYVQETNLSGMECDYSDNQMVLAKDFVFRFYITPLVMDLDGNGIDIVDQTQGVMFDMNNDGVMDKTSWVGPQDGLLAIDLNHDGIINNQSELFGNTKDVWNGFQNLALNDNNLDGVIDSKDTIFNDLAVWRDANQDGISQSGELVSLKALGIASINVNATETAHFIGDSLVSHESTFTYENGNTAKIVDVWFNVDAGAPVLETHDPLQVAIDDFVHKTSSTSNGETVSFVNPSNGETIYYAPPVYSLEEEAHVHNQSMAA
jgi:T1SS-143 domain-containing protein